MALATATITFDVADLLGIDFDTRRIKAWTTTNADNNRLIDTAANKVRMGDGVATVAADGTGSFSVWVPGADGNPTSWQQTFWFDYPLPGGRGRETRSFGPYTITGSADLADLEAEQAIPPTYLSEVTAALAEYVDDAQDARDDAVVAAAAADASAATAASAAATAAADAADAVSDELEAAVAYDVALAEAAAAEAQAAADLATDISGIGTTDEAVAVVIGEGVATRSADTKAHLTNVGSSWLNPMTEASTRVVHVVNTGTSIASGIDSVNATLSATLQKVYGDAQVTEYGFGQGSTLPAFGWKRQAFGGRQLLRFRGETGSGDITITAMNSDDQLFLEYSKDTNGGSIEVYDNDVLLGTVSCNGAQSSGNVATYTITPGTHVFRLKPIVTGSTYAYFEFLYSRKASAVGVQLDNMQFGGTSLMQIKPGTTQGIADPAVMATPETISGFSGIDALFARPSADLIVSTYTVNDVGALSPETVESEWKPLIDRAVAKTRENNVPLLWIIEMAGHYAIPEDGKHEVFGLVRDYLLKIGRDNNHITTFDWDGLTRLPDLVDYFERFYVFSVYDPETGAITGDAIHPAHAGLVIGTAGIHAMLGLPAPSARDSRAQDAQILARPGDPILDHSSATVITEGVARHFSRATGLAIAGGEKETVPFYISDDLPQTSGSRTIQDMIAASPLVDRTGRHIAPSSDLFIGGADLVAGQSLWNVMKFEGSMTLSANAGEIYTGTGKGPIPHDGERPGYQVFSVGEPTWIAWKQGPTGAGSTCTPYLGGANYEPFKIYEFCSTVSDYPVFTRRASGLWASPGPATFAAGDPSFSGLSVGQTYLEDLTGIGTGTTRKTLLGPAVRPISNAEGGSGSQLNGRTRIVGIYRTSDDAMVLTAQVGGGGPGALTTTGAGELGGTGNLAANPGSHTFIFEPPLTAMGLPASGIDRRTLAMRQPSTPLNFVIFYQSASDGANKVWWNPYTRTWVTSSYQIDPTGITPGVVMSLPIDLPLQSTLGSTGAALGATAYLIVQFIIGGASTNVYATATLARGSSALVLT